ncbi:MAG TPA: hypothetical protein PK200_07665, partial [Spirochaetota bacterium]|nr:hypothetical protein [Spirochaetota bacterium]
MLNLLQRSISFLEKVGSITLPCAVTTEKNVTVINTVIAVVAADIRANAAYTLNELKGLSIMLRRCFALKRASTGD